MHVLHLTGELEEGDAEEEEEDAGSSTQGSVRIRPNSDFLVRYVTGLEKVNEKSAAATTAAASAAAAAEQASAIEAACT